MNTELIRTVIAALFPFYLIMPYDPLHPFDSKQISFIDIITFLSVLRIYKHQSRGNAEPDLYQRYSLSLAILDLLCQFTSLAQADMRPCK